MNFKRRQYRRLSVDITPLIDVIFLLLIFFMISTTFITAPGIHVNLPTADGKSNPKTTDPIEVTITEKSEVFINGRSTKLDAVNGALANAKKATKNNTVIIKADGNVRHQLVVDVMDAAKQAGITKLSIATRPKTIPPAQKK